MRLFFVPSDSKIFQVEAVRCLFAALLCIFATNPNAIAQQRGFGALPDTAAPTLAFGLASAVGKITSLPAASSGPLPTSLDWQSLGAVTAVRDQQGCGSCALFSTTAVVESHILRTTGLAVDLSEYQFLGCRGYSICGSGSVPSQNLSYLQSVGITTEANRPYPTTYSVPATSCSVAWPASTYPFRAVAYEGITVRSVEDLKRALRDFGPVATVYGVTPSLASFMNNSQPDTAVYRWPGDAWTSGHAVLLVGYDDARNAFKIKNSWGIETGANGYLWLDYNTVLGAPRLGSWEGMGTFAVTASAVPSGFTPPPQGISFSNPFLTALSATPNALAVSNSVIVNATSSAPIDVSVSGGEWSRNCSGSFVSAGGSINRGDSVCVRHRTAAGEGKNTATVLRAGDKSLTFLSLTRASSPTPPAVLSGIAKIATGSAHTCAMTTSGGVKCWGDNQFKQLGGAAANSSIPVDVAGLSGITDITSGGNHTCALGTGGSVKCWGSNLYQQLGSVGPDNGTPQTVPGVSGLTALASGGDFTCGITAASGLKCWGAGVFTAAFAASGNRVASAAVDVAGASGVSRIATGQDHLCIAASGGVQCWGRGRFGKLGNGSEANLGTPTTVAGLPSGSIDALVASGQASCVAISGTPWCWGYNASGELGNPLAYSNAISPPTASAVPIKVSLADIVQMGSGRQSMCALNRSGVPFCSGDNNFGEQGVGTLENGRTPSPLRELPYGLAASLSVSASAVHNCMVTSSGSAYCWGNASDDQTASASESPLITTPSAVVSQSADSSPRAFGFKGRVNIPPSTLQTSGPAIITRINAAAPVSVTNGEYSVGCSGSFTASASTIQNGQTICLRHVSSPSVGVATTTIITVGGYSTGFKTITGNPIGGVSKLFAGSNFEGLCFQRSNGANYCFGKNDSFALVGDTSNDEKKYPVQLTGALASLAAIAPGALHRCAINSAGGVVCWGYNLHGQLGNGSVADAVVVAPAPVTAAAGLASGVAQVVSGAYQSCAIKFAGSVYCWGYFIASDQANPTAVPSGGAYTGANATQIAIGGYHACILVSTGAIGCFGSNDYGGVGNGAGTGYVSTPITPAGMSSGVQQVVAGNSFSCALKAGAVYCWGYNAQGAIGDGTVVNRYVPTLVTGLSSGVVEIAASGVGACARLSSGQVKCWGLYTSFGVNDFGTDQVQVPTLVTGISTSISAIRGGGTAFYGMNGAGEIEVWGGASVDFSRGNGVANDGLGWVKVLDGSTTAPSLPAALVTLTRFPDGTVASDQIVTLTARVLQPGYPTGTVTFYRGNTAVPECTNLTFQSNSQLTQVWAACNLTGLNIGSQALSATYSGDLNSGTGTSSAAPVVVTPGLVYCKRAGASVAEPAILARFLSGVTGVPLVAGLLPSARVTAQAAADALTFLNANRAAYDFDGDGNVSLSVDAVIYARYALGFRGSALTSGLAIGGARTGQQIEASLAACN